MEWGTEMHQWVTAATSAFLILGLASATPAAATPLTFGTGQSDDRLFAGSLTVARNLQPWVEPVVALLSLSPPNDIDNSEIQFPPRADEFESWPGHDWQP
jgi:hypothetical protein